jgi:hypothetical protein
MHTTPSCVWSMHRPVSAPCPVCLPARHPPLLAAFLLLLQILQDKVLRRAQVEAALSGNPALGVEACATNGGDAMHCESARTEI